jgi:hypothetical protein
MGAVALFNGRPWVVCGFSFCLGLSEGNIATYERTELTFTKSAYNRVPTNVSAKRSLLKRTMDATDFISIRIERRKHRRCLANDCRWLLNGDTRYVLGVKISAKFIHKVRIENVVRKRFLRDAGEGSQHLCGRSKGAGSERVVNTLRWRSVVGDPLFERKN